MIDPSDVAFFAPRNVALPKSRIYDAIGKTCGAYCRSMVEFKEAAERLIPASFCFPQTANFFYTRKRLGQPFIYFDRGYFGRGKMSYAGLGSSVGHGNFRVHVNSFQLEKIADRRPGRFETTGLNLSNWRKGGDEIIVAMQSEHYKKYHALRDWEKQALLTLGRHTRRPIRLRYKTRNPSLLEDLANAHALVTHGSIAAVEAAILGVPVFVSEWSAARFVGSTDLTKIDTPVYPPRLDWARALANSQFHFVEIARGAFWERLEV